MSSPLSEPSMSEYVASRRNWRSSTCRTFCFHDYHRNSYTSIEARASCPGAWRKGFSGSGKALNLFFFGLPQMWCEGT